eukprot:9077564-Alexandrium_andersonii.AAC.1
MLVAWALRACCAGVAGGLGGGVPRHWRRGCRLRSRSGSAGASDFCLGEELLAVVEQAVVALVVADV